MEPRSQFESLQVGGMKMMESLEHLLKEGNARRISIRKDHETVAEFPLTFGVIGAVLAPAVAAVGTGAALLTGCTFHFERVTEPADFSGPRVGREEN